MDRMLIRTDDHPVGEYIRALRCVHSVSSGRELAPLRIDVESSERVLSFVRSRRLRLIPS